MRILFVGDTHGMLNVDKLNDKTMKKINLSKDDLIIHCGDIGIMWNEEDAASFDFWNNLPCPTMVNLGNHENFNWIERQPVGEMYGAKGYQLSEKLFAPMVGEVMTIKNKTFWFFPGGYSIDYGFRVLNRTIYQQELPLTEDAKRAIERLKKIAPVDVIVSHDGPRSFITKYFGYPIGDLVDNYLVKVEEERGKRVHPGFALDEVYENKDLFKRWYFGHHHKDFEAENIRCLMHKMVLWDALSDTIDII